MSLSWKGLYNCEYTTLHTVKCRVSNVCDMRPQMKESGMLTEPCVNPPRCFPEELKAPVTEGVYLFPVIRGSQAFLVQSLMSPP